MVTKINFASKFIQMHLVAAHYTDPILLDELGEGLGGTAREGSIRKEKG